MSWVTTVGAALLLAGCGTSGGDSGGGRASGGESNVGIRAAEAGQAGQGIGRGARGGEGASSKGEPSAAEVEGAASLASPAVGKMAADFTLPGQWDEPVTLSKLRGKWVVLYFYPADDTPGCTCQATEFTQLVLDFDRLGAKVLGVSPDNSAMHRFFINEHRLSLTLLSDPERQVMKEYGAWVEVPSGPAAPGHVDRCTYLIDPSGKIAWCWPEVIPQGHAGRVRGKLEELRRKYGR